VIFSAFNHRRKVRAFNSSIDTKVDVCVEVFHLEPRSGGRSGANGASGTNDGA
jgi:hypothetical protein